MLWNMDPNKRLTAQGMVGKELKGLMLMDEDFGRELHDRFGRGGNGSVVFDE